jgi:ankyrin repeat protein
MAYKPWDSLAGNPVLEAALEASDVNLDILRGLL